MISLHRSDLLTSERQDEIIGFVIKQLEIDEPYWVKIIDPFFQLENYLRDKAASKNFWRYFLDELGSLKELQKIKIITQKPFAEYVKDNYKVTRGLERLTSDNMAKYTFEGLHDNEIALQTFYHQRSKNKFKLHDRWFIWGRNQFAKAFHFGSFREDIEGIDITITEMAGHWPGLASKHFDQITGDIH